MSLGKIFAFVVLAAAALTAQTFRGGIVGTVSDNKGAAVADARVQATQVGTGLVRETVSGANGDYGLPELPLGEYTVTITKEGFLTQTLIRIHVGLSIPESLNVTLTPGEVEQKIEKRAQVSPISTTNTLGGTLESFQVSQLPVNGRDYTKLLVMIPGANVDGSEVSDSPHSFGVFSVNGNRGRSNNFLLDGTDMNDGFRNDPAINQGGEIGIRATLLPLDAIQEMAILDNTEAEYGRNSGSIVNIVTKSGTNDVHGSLFEYFRNNHLDARNYFNQKPDPANVFHNNQFGASLGGPIRWGQTFGFLAYEGQQEKVGIPASATIPTQEQITSHTPAGGINPIIQNILNLNPWTNGAPLLAFGDGGPGSDTPKMVETTNIATNRLHSGIAKIDHHLNKNDLVTGRYFFGYGRQNAPLAIVGGNLLPGYNTLVPTQVQVASLSLTHVMSPRALVEVRGGWNQFRETFSAADNLLDPASLGLNTTSNPNDFGLPVILVDSYAQIGVNKSVPRGRTDTNAQYFTNFSLNSGKHNWKLGYEFRRTSVTQFFDANHRGTLVFNSLADFLAGTLDGGSRVLGDSHRNTFQNNHAVYLQDSFRYTRRLTINYGVRWDYFGVIGEKNNLFSIFSPSIGLEQIGASGTPSSLYPKDHKNFSPRIGAAYDAFGSGKTILRAGWGLMYDAFSQDLFAGQLPFNTSNAGPLFNGTGTRPILFANSPDAKALVVTPAPCGTNQITVPGTSTGLCTGPVFSTFTANDVFTVAQNLRTPYVQNYNLNIEQQLGARTALTVGYVGSKGRKLFRFRDINQPNGLSGVRPFDLGPFTPSGTRFGVVNQLESAASSGYNSLQARLSVRSLHGLASALNYTYSHSLDTASDGQDYVPNAALPDNSFNPQGNRGNSNFDARHRFSWLFNYRLPESHAAAWLTSGWGLDGVLSLSTGMPFNVNDFNVFNTRQLSPGQPVGEFIERPDLVGNPFSGTHTPGTFLNLSAFQAPCSVAPIFVSGVGECPGVPHFGTLSRNKFYGPHFRNFDVAFTKDTRISERVNMQLRADVFNVFNHPNFSNPLNPNGVVDWTSNGLDASGRGQGFLPITTTPDVGAQNPYLGAGGPRNLEIAVRFVF
jgi:hypothetical protein